MTKHGNKWLVDRSGAKLITFKKTNSTSNFKSKKIGGYKGYKEKQPTKNDLLKWFESLSTSNKELTKSNARLTVTNKMQQKTINNLRNKLNDSQPTTNKLLGQVNKDMKKISLNTKHGLIWKLFH